MDKQRIFFGVNKRPQDKSTIGNDQNKNKELNDENKEDVIEFSKHVQESLIRQQKLQDDLDKRKRAKQVILPTNDNLIKLKFRELDEPIILFGETSDNRRARLKHLLLDRGLVDGYPLSERKKQDEKKQKYQQAEEFLTHGEENLKQSRIDIALFSLELANKRIQSQKRKRDQELQIQSENKKLFEDYQESQIERQQKQYRKIKEQQQQQQQNEQNGEKQEEKQQQDDSDDIDMTLPLEPIKFKNTEYENQLETVIRELKSYYPSLSQVGDEKISGVCFSPDSKMVATSSWGGMLKLWDIDGRERIENTFTGHTQRINGLAFHPGSTLTQSPSSCNLATVSCDNTCKLWSLESTAPLATLEGHLGFVNRVVFHPMGRFIATSSYDRSWRLWDVESQKVLLDQEGHSEPIFGIAIQCDGSLIATGGQDSLVRVWDLRSGLPVIHYQGHSKQIISIDWSPNGYQFATSSEDNSVRIWDLRNPTNNYTILAHSAIVSCVKFQKQQKQQQPEAIGYLVSGSFDNNLKTWSPNDWKPISTLECHSSKVTSLDISNDGTKIVSGSFDKTWKIWSL